MRLFYDRNVFIVTLSMFSTKCVAFTHCNVISFRVYWSGASSVSEWLIDLRFYVPLKNFSLIWRRHHCRWRAAKFRPMLGAQGLWAGRDLYCATPAVTWDLGFSGLIGRTAPFSRLLRHTRGCGGSILIRILTGRQSVVIRNQKTTVWWSKKSDQTHEIYSIRTWNIDGYIISLDMKQM